MEERAGVNLAVLAGALGVGEPYQRLLTGEGFVEFFGKARDRVALCPGYEGRASYLVDAVRKAVLRGDPKSVHHRVHPVDPQAALLERPGQLGRFLDRLEERFQGFRVHVGEAIDDLLEHTEPGKEAL